MDSGNSLKLMDIFLSISTTDPHLPTQLMISFGFLYLRKPMQNATEIITKLLEDYLLKQLKIFLVALVLSSISTTKTKDSNLKTKT